MKAIRWTEPAARDLEEICEFLETEAGPKAALSMVRTLYEGVQTLARFPNRGRIGRFGARELVLPGSPYIVFYELGRRRSRSSPSGMALGVDLDG